MKKIVLFLVSFLLFIIGCAGFKVERKVQNNIFYSSRESKIAIKFNYDFKYLGETETSKHGESVNQSVGPGTVYKRDFLYIRRNWR